MRVGQQSLGHAHRQERYAAFFDKDADLVVGLRVCRAFTENNQGAPGALQEIERARDSGRVGKLGRVGVDDLDQ